MLLHFNFLSTDSVYVGYHVTRVATHLHLNGSARLYMAIAMLRKYTQSGSSYESRWSDLENSSLCWVWMKCSHINSVSQICIWELWDVPAFLLTKLLDFCSQVPCSFKLLVSMFTFILLSVSVLLLWWS